MEQPFKSYSYAKTLNRTGWPTIHFKAITLLVLFCTTPSLGQINKDSLWTVWENIKQPDTTRFKSIYVIIRDHYLYKTPDSAIYYSKLAEKFSQDRNMEKQFADALRLKAFAFYLKGDFYNSMLYNSRSLNIKEKIKDSVGISFSLNNIGLVYYELKEYDSAKKAFEQSLAIHEKLKDTLRVAFSLNNLGMIYLDNKDYPEALSHFNKSLAIKENSNDKRGVANTLNNIGLMEIELKNYNKALAHFKRSLSLKKEIGDRNYGSSFGNMAQAYFKLGDYQQAIAYSKQGLSIAQKNAVLEGVLASSEYLYKSYREIGQSQLALNAYEIYITAKDSMNSERSEREVIRQQYRYEYEKQAVSDSIAFTKEQEIKDTQIRANEAELQKKRIEEYVLIGGILLVLTFLTLLNGRLKIIKNQKLIIEEKNKEIASAMTTLEAKALRVQMNPHFIFNALNGIQSVLFLKGERKANEYFGLFSKLMRFTLDMNSFEDTTLANEIDYLKSYASLENMRINGRLDIQFNIDPELDLEHIKIPSMLFQPIVENAILHGLMPKADDRTLVISMQKQGDFLEGTVLDNGIGREASSELRQQKKGLKPHKSWATNILKDRIEHFNATNEKDMTFTIIDLKENNKASGTKVVLKIPIVQIL
ncbi:MAG: tetratricopeptide repeat protein [Bacteroidota bacterium]